ncbi:cardiolipin synthase [Acidisoma silvae]|uniref:Cardiolipin synthase n=1 Tax=Acidisoma silvae TaxID=2802396 RepID=A0A963YQ32_9PROT|nr:cardiolipin synthase [Acidisoma silvae]MCB8874716.1 cardiolipin synthase [Acidisoma silvae]
MIDWFEFVTRIKPGLELSIGLVIAVAVTVHVLLTKKDTASATAWIGLAWLAPFFGGATYFVLGINRVRRRAIRLRAPSAARTRRHRKGGDAADADHRLAPLQLGISRITGRPIETGNRIDILNNGDGAYPAMLEAIARAEHSIGLSSYIFRADKIGHRFIAALAEAQKRGVTVRVIVDGIGSGWLLSPAYRALRQAGLPAGRFMHSALPWRMSFLNLRSHKKILVVDGRIGFTGGVNVADQNLLANNPPEPIQDTHFRIEGPIVAQLTYAFIRDWAFVAQEELEGEAWYPELRAHGHSIARVVTAGPDEDLEKIEQTILQAIACSRTSIQVMTPYFLPDQRVITALGLAAQRGVAVDIVIPSKNVHRTMDWATQANVGPLLEAGVRIWRCPPPFRHSKLMVIEGEWSLIGSSNWDMRSFRLNFELSIESYDKALAASLGQIVAENHSLPLTLEELNARPFPIRMRDAAARLLLPYL